jgi:hypothetical protein
MADTLGLGEDPHNDRVHWGPRTCEMIVDFLGNFTDQATQPLFKAKTCPSLVAYLQKYLPTKSKLSVAQKKLKLVRDSAVQFYVAMAFVKLPKGQTTTEHMVVKLLSDEKYNQIIEKIRREVIYHNENGEYLINAKVEQKYFDLGAVLKDNADYKQFIQEQSAKIQQDANEHAERMKSAGDGLQSSRTESPVPVNQISLPNHVDTSSTTQATLVAASRLSTNENVERSVASVRSTPVSQVLEFEEEDDPVVDDSIDASSDVPHFSTGRPRRASSADSVTEHRVLGERSTNTCEATPSSHGKRSTGASSNKLESAFYQVGNEMKKARQEMKQSHQNIGESIANGLVSSVSSAMSSAVSSVSQSENVKEAKTVVDKVLDLALAWLSRPPQQPAPSALPKKKKKSSCTIISSSPATTISTILSLLSTTMGIPASFITKSCI